MKPRTLTYTYAYKSSDGMRHEAAMEAPSRDEVFAALRKQGIKPIKVVAADGSKANGEIRGVRKRIVALVALCLTLAAVVASVFSFRAGENKPATGNRQPTTAPRHQIYGDPAIMQDFERGRFEAMLPDKADQMLAWFTQPGKLMCPKNMTQAELRRLDDKSAAALSDAASNPDIASKMRGC